MQVNPKKFPLLNQLIAEGKIKLLDGEWCGLASDGVWVSIGSKGEEKSAERYLQTNGTPEKW